MKSIKRILWAYDGSEESRYALKYAIYLAKTFNSEITGLHVNTITDLRFTYYSHYAYFMEKAAEDHDKEFTLKLDCIKNHLDSEKIKFNSKIIRGYSDIEIATILEKENFDLVVMGVTGRGLLGRMLIGSTTSKVIEKSQTPVFAVRKPEIQNEVKISKILVPIDISEKFESAFNNAVELAEIFECNITVIYVINIGLNFYEIPKDLIDEILDETKTELKKRIDKVKEKFSKDQNHQPIIRPKILFGMNAGIKIADYAKKNNFDLIVMNTHAKKTLSTRILGSVTNQVIQNSYCPVLAMKP